MNFASLTLYRMKDNPNSPGKVEKFATMLTCRTILAAFLITVWPWSFIFWRQC